MGLTAARASALSVVVVGGPVTIGQLAKAEQVAAPTMTRLVVRMEREGLLKRARDERDGRIVWLRATPKATRVLEEGRHRRVGALASALAVLDASELELLARAAELMDRVLERDREPRT